MTEVAWDDTGIVTCWLEQDYVLEGKPDHVWLRPPSCYTAKTVSGRSH